MLDTCACLCGPANHYGICQVVPSGYRRHVLRRLAVTPDAPVCEACYQAVCSLLIKTGVRRPFRPGTAARRDQDRIRRWIGRDGMRR